MTRYSEGSFDYNTLYNMPIHLREYNLDLMVQEAKSKNRQPNEMTLEDVEAGAKFKHQKELPEGTMHFRKAT